MGERVVAALLFQECLPFLPQSQVDTTGLKKQDVNLPL